jgi:hypothetical protein
MTTQSSDIEKLHSEVKVDLSSDAEAVKPRVPIYEKPVMPVTATIFKFQIGDVIQVDTPSGYRVMARVAKQGPDPISMAPSYQLLLIPESSYMFLSKEWAEAHGGKVTP